MDELQQIFNILFGQMSVVGPRPALYNQDDLVAARDEYGANDVRPGLTGWAQVNGRDELEIDVKAALDGEYVKKMSLGLDVKIFFMTLGKVFKSDGVVEGGTGAMQSRPTEQPPAEDKQPTAEAAATTDPEPIVLDSLSKTESAANTEDAD